jgi:hypothetical protein
MGYTYKNLLQDTRTYSGNTHPFLLSMEVKAHAGKPYLVGVYLLGEYLHQTTSVSLPSTGTPRKLGHVLRQQ